MNDIIQGVMESNNQRLVNIEYLLERRIGYEDDLKVPSNAATIRFLLLAKQIETLAHHSMEAGMTLSRVLHELSLSIFILQHHPERTLFQEKAWVYFWLDKIRGHLVNYLRFKIHNKTEQYIMQSQGVYNCINDPRIQKANQFIHKKKKLVATMFEIQQWCYGSEVSDINKIAQWIENLTWKFEDVFDKPIHDKQWIKFIYNAIKIIEEKLDFPSDNLLTKIFTEEKLAMEFYYYRHLGNGLSHAISSGVIDLMQQNSWDMNLDKKNAGELILMVTLPIELVEFAWRYAPKDF